VALRILIVDDHAAVRRSIRSLLESYPNWKVCGEGTNGREAVEQARRLKPDVVLLDMTMPELNGLEATRRILREAPETQVLVLTMHQSDELADEVRRAGAKALVLKSNAQETLAAAIESLRKMAVHLAGCVVDRFRHIGAFFSSEAERYRVLAPFVAEGLKQGEKAFHIIEPPGREHYFRRLREAGIDVDRAEAQGQAEFVPWEDAPLRQGHFDQQEMLTFVHEALSRASAQGFSRSRLIGHMEWALEDRPGVHDLVEYEARLNFLLPNFDDVVTCAYDLTKFGGDVIVDVIRTHPAVVIGESLYENPFYVPPDQMIEELRQRSLHQNRSSH
jgi:DNA-binding NarL/FixJ family response regulator